MATLIGLDPEELDVISHRRGDTFRLYLEVQRDDDGDGVYDDGPFDFTGGGFNQHTALLQVRAHPLSDTVLDEGSTETEEILLNEDGEIAVEINNFLAGVSLKKVYYDIRVKDEAGAEQTLFYGYINLNADVSR